MTGYDNLRCHDCGRELPEQNRGAPKKLCSECRHKSKLRQSREWRDFYRGHPAMGTKRKWSQEELDYLTEAWPKISAIIIARKIGRHVSTVRSKANDLGLKHDDDFEIYNHQRKEIGHLKKNRHSMWVRKINNTGLYRRDWAYEHRRLWEEKHGEIPCGHMLIFKDGDHDNLSIDNFELISRKDFIIRHNIHKNYPKELLETIFTLGWFKRKLRERIESEQ